MPKTIPLLTGTYKAKSIIASAQTCKNLYPEINPPDSETPVTHYPAPGLVQLVTPPFGAGPGRGIYLSTTNQLFAVIDVLVYEVNTLLNTMTVIGDITSGTTPVSMTDNGTQMVVVAGKNLGWTYTFATGIWAQINDPAFQGADYVGYLDGFTIFNNPGTNFFYSTLANQITPFDALYFAQKSGFQDQIMGLVCNHREIFLIGQMTSEVWYNAGNPLFPFALIPGVFIQKGCGAKYSICRHDLFVIFISQDKDGHAECWLIEGYKARKVSNPALEQEWSAYETVEDATSFIYQLGGHTFYQVTFISADTTYVYDITTDQWHQRTWTDTDGNEHRHRAICATYAFGKIVCLDWQNGTLYALDGNTYTDAGNPIVYRRAFPHLTNSGVINFFDNFYADMEVGQSQDGSIPMLTLRWSDDRGETYGTPITQSMGQGGSYLTSIKFNRLGRARDRVFELSWSAPVKTALNGAYVQVRSAAV
jgi:hypothetical protein